MTIKFEQKKIKMLNSFRGSHSKYENAPNFVTYLEYDKCRLVSKIKKNNHEDSNTMRIKLQRRIIFTFS